MKFNRRLLLWSGLGATIAAALGRDHLQRSAIEAEQAELRQLYNPTESIQAAFRSDMTALKDTLSVQQSVKLRSPTIPYDRKTSKLLITGSKICTYQYLCGKYQADYDGSISSLPLYSEGFTSFKQVTSFKAVEQVEESIPFEIPTSELSTNNNLSQLRDRLNETKGVIQDQVKQVVQLQQKISVYYGFLLTSPKFNLLMLRGTQRQTEWLENVLALQTPYSHPKTEAEIGKVHVGIYDFYKTFLAKPIAEAVKSLDPTKPLLVAGHSLGAALAVFASMEVALLYPKLRPNLRLYAYAGPRVGDKEFIEAHSNLIPNHYRIVNLADSIPLLPMSKQLNTEFVHGGEQWSFLSYQGDIMPNHIVETYRTAIAQEAEAKIRQKVNQEFNNVHLRL
jgi:triacylglycerol lipase